MSKTSPVSVCTYLPRGFTLKFGMSGNALHELLVKVNTKQIEKLTTILYLHAAGFKNIRETVDMPCNLIGYTETGKNSYTDRYDLGSACFEVEIYGENTTVWINGNENRGVLSTEVFIAVIKNLYEEATGRALGFLGYAVEYYSDTQELYQVNTCIATPGLFPFTMVYNQKFCYISRYNNSLDVLERKPMLPGAVFRAVSAEGFLSKTESSAFMGSAQFVSNTFKLTKA